MTDSKLLMMPWFPESFIASTRGWNFTERAVYRELLDAQWIQGSIPNDEAELMRLAGCSKKEWAAAWPRVKSKFELTNGELRNPRLEEHRAKALKLTEKRRNGAALTNAKRYGNDTDSARSATRIATRSPVAQRHAQRSHDSDSDSSVLRTAGDEDPRAKIFELGKSLLGASSGGLISKAISQTDESTVFAVLGEMAARPTADPRAYFAAATKPKTRGLVL